MRLRNEFFKYIRVPTAFMAELNRLKPRMENKDIQSIVASGLNMVYNYGLPDRIYGIPVGNIIARLDNRYRLWVPGTEYEALVGSVSERLGVSRNLAKALVLIAVTRYLRVHTDAEEAEAFKSEMLGKAIKR